MSIYITFALGTLICLFIRFTIDVFKKRLLWEWYMLCLAIILACIYLSHFVGK
ncbi:hypothetical protein KGR20_21885 [Cytobacillus oceanisediminis]|uniref:hypothetical protein n=1 Tax=Cytobacillus oceanisediminis TaxID=665099 RepID=UPI001CCAA150|nr:hypothetical protein [Cytobacillus oceanisediminis]MBZ9536814.1 hypothetical protein [Cytobacillus oceanisediminis]